MCGADKCRLVIWVACEFMIGREFHSRRHLSSNLNCSPDFDVLRLFLKCEECWMRSRIAIQNTSEKNSCEMMMYPDPVDDCVVSFCSGVSCLLQVWYWWQLFLQVLFALFCTPLHHNEECLLLLLRGPVCWNGGILWSRIVFLCQICKLASNYASPRARPLINQHVVLLWGRSDDQQLPARYSFLQQPCSGYLAVMFFCGTNVLNSEFLDLQPLFSATCLVRSALDNRAFHVPTG